MTATAAVEPRRGHRVRVAVAAVSPALLVAVGYIDPGNWGTDVEAGSRFGIRLLWVLVVANLIAVFLQYLSAKLGIATGSDLAAVAGREFSRTTRAGLAAITLVSLLATDLAEFLGVVLGLEILIGGGLWLDLGLGVTIVFGLLLISRHNVRTLERAVIALLGLVAVVYVGQMWLVRPGREVLAGLAPSLPIGALPVAIGIIGATVMPHNLFLHSGVVHWRDAGSDPTQRLRRVFIGSVVALTGALLLNAAILITVGTATTRGPATGAAPDTLGAAARSLTPVLGSLATAGFGLALLAAGVAATLTSAVAGDMALTGLTAVRVSTLTRRAIAVVPAIVALAFGVGEVSALVGSQIVLSLALPVVAGALVVLTNNTRVMGRFVNQLPVRLTAWTVLAGLTAANIALLVSSLR